MHCPLGMIKQLLFITPNNYYGVCGIKSVSTQGKCTKIKNKNKNCLGKLEKALERMIVYPEEFKAVRKAGLAWAKKKNKTRWKHKQE